MKLIDLTGQTFGKLTVIRRGPNKGRLVGWICVCNCNPLVEILFGGPDLRAGRAKSCGCLRKETLKRLLTNPNNNNETWQCSACKKVKPISMFNKSKNRRNGINYVCKSCKSEYYKTNKQKLGASKRRSHIADPRHIMLSSARTRSKKYNLPFSISIDDIPIVPSHCPLLGIEMAPSTNGKVSPNSPSLDKIIPDLGYVPGNVIVISMKANYIKNDASVEELEIIAKNLRKIIDGKNICSKKQKDSGISEERCTTECIESI